MVTLKKLTTSLKERGAIGTLRYSFYRLVTEMRIFVDRKFDHRFGVDTSGLIETENLDISESQKSAGYRYEPTNVSFLHFVLKRLTIDHSIYTFIDFGSGKGRVLLLASEYPYKKIIGVEFSQSLCRIAKNNFKTWNNPKQKCFNIELICMDARDFKLPHDPLILYFFTPFTASVASQVVNNIQKSIDDNPRPIQILYYGSNQNFIDQLAKLNFTCKEIYSHRPFTAINSYKGLHFILET